MAMNWFRRKRKQKQSLPPIGYLAPKGVGLCEPCAIRAGMEGHNERLGFDWRGAWLNEPDYTTLEENDSEEYPYFVLYADGLTYPQLRAYLNLRAVAMVDPIETDPHWGKCSRCNEVWISIDATPIVQGEN